MKNKMKITHDFGDFNEGEDVILTLKDQYLIKDDDLNEDQQELQNIQLREKGQSQFKAYMRENIQKLAHVNTSHLEYRLEGNNEKALLPHYDQRKYEKVGLNIDVDEDRNELVFTKGIIEKMKQQKEQKQQESLNIKQNVIASEYMAPEKKVIKARKVVDKSKSTKQLINFLEEDAEQGRNSDLRKKQNTLLKEKELEDTGKYNEHNFTNAVKKAEQKVRALEQYQLELALLKQRNKNRQFLKPPQPVKQEEKQEQSSQKFVQIQLDPIMAFHKGNIDSQQQVSFTSNLSLKDTKTGTASVLNVPLPSQRFKHKLKQLQQEQQIPESFQDIDPEDLESMKKQLEFMEEERNVGVGLSGTLKFLREKGMLGKQQYVGRNKDQKVNYNLPDDKIKLEYRDEQGRLLTQKEAYRMISQRFHGQMPGKNKQEKRKKRDLLNEKIKSKQAGGTTMMNILQSQTEQAHMFIKKY